VQGHRVHHWNLEPAVLLLELLNILLLQLPHCCSSLQLPSVLPQQQLLPQKLPWAQEVGQGGSPN
jgi:hypothetical protein